MNNIERLLIQMYKKQCEVSDELRQIKALLSANSRTQARNERTENIAPPTLDEIIKYANDNRLGKSKAEITAFHEHFKAMDWKDRNGKSVLKLWQVKLKQWKFIAEKESTKINDFNKNDRILSDEDIKGYYMTIEELEAMDI